MLPGTRVLARGVKPGEGAEKTPLDVDVPDVHVCSSTNKYVLKIGLTVGFTVALLILRTSLQ